MHAFLGLSAQLPKGACCQWTLVWVRVEHFCYDLDRVKTFLHIVLLFVREGLQHCP